MSQKLQVKNRELVVFLKKDDFFDNTLSEKVKKIISKIPDRNLTLSEIINLLGNDGLLIFASILSIIFLIPVSIPGISTVFGGIIFFIGISNFLNKSLWLPSSIKNKLFPSEKLRTALNKGLKWFYFLEKISKPHRFRLITCNKIASKINGFLILFGSILLMIPLGLMPFSNTLPALIILFLSIGIIQKDGIIILLGYFSVLGAFIYFGLFFSTIILAFKKIVESITM
jgi:hypothetical protein